MRHAVETTPAISVAVGRGRWRRLESLQRRRGCGV